MKGQKNSRVLIKLGLALLALSISALFYIDFQKQQGGTLTKLFSAEVESTKNEQPEQTQKTDQEAYKMVSAQSAELGASQQSTQPGELEVPFDPEQFALRLSELDQQRQENAQNHRLLEQINQRINNDEITRSQLQNEFASPSVGEQQRLLLKQELSELALPSQERKELDPTKLLSKSNQRAEGQLPEKVLQDVERTTGITADEINELMNQ